MPVTINGSSGLTANDGSVFTNASGNVGIGTSSPINLLTVQTSATGTTAGSNVIARFQSNASGRDATIQLSDNVANSATVSMVGGATVFRQNGTESMRVASDGSVGIGTSSFYSGTGANLTVSNGIDCGLGTGSGTSLAFVRQATAGTIGTISGKVPGYTDYCGITLYAENTGGGSQSGSLRFFTSNNASVAERARIDSSGNLLVGTTSIANLPGSGTSNATGVAIGNNQLRACKDEYTFQIGVTSTGSRILQQFFQAGTNCGEIRVANSNSTSYVTSSDYRLKDAVQPMTEALAKVAALKPCTWTWKNSGTPGQGFIAHELQAVVPDAVSGEKDAVNEDGSIKAQGVDTSFLVATLTAAIQEQQALIESLTARIAALEGSAQ